MSKKILTFAVISKNYNRVELLVEIDANDSHYQSYDHCYEAAEETALNELGSTPGDFDFHYKLVDLGKVRKVTDAA